MDNGEESKDLFVASNGGANKNINISASPPSIQNQKTGGGPLLSTQPNSQVLSILKQMNIQKVSP